MVGCKVGSFSGSASEIKNCPKPFKVLFNIGQGHYSLSRTLPSSCVRSFGILQLRVSSWKLNLSRCRGSCTFWMRKDISYATIGSCHCTARPLLVRKPFNHPALERLRVCHCWNLPNLLACCQCPDMKTLPKTAQVASSPWGASIVGGWHAAIGHNRSWSWRPLAGCET